MPFAPLVAILNLQNLIENFELRLEVEFEMDLAMRIK